VDKGRTPVVLIDHGNPMNVLSDNANATLGWS
jgi:hypothetical protein